MSINPDIEDDLATDEEAFTVHNFRNKSTLLALATLLESHGLTTRHAETIAADVMDMPDPMGEKRNLQALAERLDIDRSTLRSHEQESDETVRDAMIVRGMLHEPQKPKQIIATHEVSSHIDECDSLQISIGRYFDPDEPPKHDEEYAIYLTKYDDTGWNEKQYVGEEIRRVTGRHAVLDEVNRILAEFQSKFNPVPLIGELMHVLDIPEGPLDTDSEHNHRISVIDPLHDPNGPPEEYEKPPHTFGGHSSLVDRPEHE